MPAYARLRDDLISVPTEIDGTTYYTIKDPVTGNYFRLRGPEFWLIRQLDGHHSPEQIARQFSEKYATNLTSEAVGQFVEELQKLFFLEDSRSEQEISRASKRAFRRKSLFRRLLYIKLRAFHPGPLLEKITGWYRPFYRPGWLWLQLIVVLFGMTILIANRSSFFQYDIRSLFSLGSVSAVVVSLFIIIIVHEFGHAVICRLYGGEVSEMGFLLLYFQPCFYTDVSDAWLFAKKAHRLLVTAAGPLIQLFLTALAVLVWRVSVPGTFVSEVARIIVTVSMVTYLFNFNPLIKLDGYYFLSDLLEIPNLRSRAFAYLGNVFKRKLLGWPVAPLNLTRRERRVFGIYAILSLIYSSFLVGFVLVIVARYLIERFGGAGFLLLTLALFLILIPGLKKLGQGVLTHLTYMRQILKKPLRLTIHLVIIGVVVVLGITVPVPHRVSGDIIVKPIAEYSLAMNEFGLIESRFHHGGAHLEDKVSIMQMNSSDVGTMEFVPMVKDGQRVMQDDTIAILTSNQIVQEIRSAEAELARLESKLSLLKAPPKQEEVLEAQSKAAAAQTSYMKKLSDYQRAEELAAKELIPESELENSRSLMEIARAQWRSAQSAVDLLKAPPRKEEEVVLEHDIDKQRARLSFLQNQGDAQVIAAPFEGIVSRQSSDRSILSVLDHDSVELLIPVSDFDISRVAVGQPVTIKVRSYPGELFRGKVVRIPEAAVERGGQMFFEVAAAVDNDGGMLRDGMTGYAKIEVGHSSVVSLLYRKFLSRIRVEFWSWW